MTVLIVVETVILLVLSVLVVGLLRSYATVLQRLHHLDGGVEQPAAPPFRTAEGVLPPPDRNTPSAADRYGSGRDGRAEWAQAHDIVGEGLSGEVVSVRTVGVPQDTVIAFLSSGCSGCTGFWEQLADRRAISALGHSRVLVVTKSPADESISVLRELSSPGVDLVMSSAAWVDYDVPGSPYVVVVDGRTGRVKGEGSGTSLSQVSGLMQQAYGDSASFPGVRPVVKPRSDTEREVDVDRTLLAAGIGPGHPSLYGADFAADMAARAAAQPRHRRLNLLPRQDHPEATK
jgi:hypothetical protein